MDPIVIGLISFALIMILIFLNIPVSFSLFIVGIAGLVILLGLRQALATMAIIAFENATLYDLAVMPLFLLMGEIVAHGNIAKDAYDMARGGWGMSRVV